MSENFRIFIKDEGGDLYLKPVGDFDDEAAWEIIRALGKMYDGKGNVIIDTEKLENVRILGCGTFRFQFYLCGVPCDRLFFKGENGYFIAPRGSRVLHSSPPRPCGCDGNCDMCRYVPEKKIA